MKTDNRSLIYKTSIVLLKPLIRILIRNEVSHSEFAELARQAYVETAYEHFALPKRKMTFARASVLTGLSRKEVVRLKKTSSEAPKEKKIKANKQIPQYVVFTLRHKCL